MSVHALPDTDEADERTRAEWSADYLEALGDELLEAVGIVAARQADLEGRLESIETSLERVAALADRVDQLVTAAGRSPIAARLLGV